MILNVIEDNPLRPFMENYMLARSSMDFPELGWSVDMDVDGTGTAFNIYDFKTRIAPLLPPCNILVRYISEASNWEYYQNAQSFKTTGAAMLLSGVEFIDEGGVTSVQDTVTEVTLSFIALDLKPISANTFTSNPFDVPTMAPLDIREFLLQRRLSTEQMYFRHMFGNPTPPPPIYEPWIWGTPGGKG